MTAAAVQPQPRIRSFVLQRETLQKLAELRGAVTASAYVQFVVSMAHDVLVLDRPILNERFGPRLRQLAAQLQHARAWKPTSFNLDDDDMNAIREVRDVLRLPRQDLVVEYAVQAAWDTKPGDDGGGNSGKEDPRDRKRRLARFHNVESSRALRSMPLPGELSLFDEEVSTKS